MTVSTCGHPRLLERVAANILGPRLLMRNPGSIGSKLYVTAGGVTQYRQQNGDFHRWSQNLMRVHVNLAANTLVDTTTVLWPDNSSTTYTGLAADHTFQLKQNGTYTQIH